MAIFKCKMCGAPLNVEEGKTIIECDSCGTKQTLPKLDDEKKANLFDRANHFRRNNEFDKAETIYEQILEEEKTDAEAYWSLVLCRYGIEYVEDPKTHKRVPTVNRAQYTSILADENYKSALRYADGYQKTIYEEEAKEIDKILKGILSISQSEEPFDVFICYKETDSSGSRTKDSVLANDIYHQLTNEGFKVFFAKITLEDKLGSAYEPYIFAALNSAKVMIALGTKSEYFNAPWVKNEWKRFLSLIKDGANKMLIPCYRDMDPYDLPEEFSHLQAQDMSKIGFMQDIIHGVKKILEKDSKPTTVINNFSAQSNYTALLKRMFMFLEDGDFASADEYAEKTLDNDPENAEAYLGKLMAELKIRQRENLSSQERPINESANFQKAFRFGDEKLRSELRSANDTIKRAITERQCKKLYDDGLAKMKAARSSSDFLEASRLFLSISKYIKDYQDSAMLSEKCREQAEIAQKDEKYDAACKLLEKSETIQNVENAIERFTQLADFKDSPQKIAECQAKIEELKRKEEELKAEKKRREEEARLEAERKKVLAKERAKKCKKILKRVGIIAASCAVVAAIGVGCGFGVKNRISYRKRGNEYAISSRNFFFDLTCSKLTVAEYNGVPISEIEDEVFQKSKIKSISLSGMVTRIGDRAFEKSKLEEVTISGNSIKIGAFAFADCTSLSSLTIGNGVSGFEQANTISPTAGAGVEIGEGAFKNTGLESIQIDNVHSIGANAFSDCNNLKEVVLAVEDSATVNAMAFGGLSSETTIFVPSVSPGIYSKIKSSSPNITLKTFTLDAAKECAYFIEKIGKVTLESEEDISRAEEIYENLTAAQKSQVSNYPELVSARKVFDVMKDIADIGTVTIDSNAKITEAENAYENLTAKEKVSVENYSELTSARSTFKVLSVMDKINGIGTVTLESDEKISLAEEEYNKLNEKERNQITNHDTLVEARSRYKVLCVIKCIEDIGSVSLESEEKIALAEKSYGELSESERGQVSNYDVLLKADGKFKALVVVDSINKLGTITLDSKKKIDEIEKAYAQLSQEEKELVSNYDKLIAAKGEYKQCKIRHVIELIEGIGTVTVESKDKIAQAKKEYEALEADEKEQITNYDVLVKAESQYKVEVVIDMIDRLGEITYRSNDAITSAEQEYEKLSAEEKGRVKNYQTLVSARSKYRVANVVHLIDSLGTITEKSNDVITNAEKEYAKLTQAEKSSVSNYDKLLEMRKQFNDLQFLTFTLSGGTYSVSAKDKSIQGEISIPQRYNNKDVTAIAKEGFGGCFSLEGITIPEGMKSIGDDAFNGCRSLKRVVWNAIDCTGKSIFSGKTALDDLTIGDKVQTIPSSAFSGCTALKKLILGKNVREIESSAFSYCTSLSSVTFSDSLQSIGMRAFGNCSALTSVSIGNSVQEIYDCAFEKCSALKNVTIGNGVKEIGWGAFENCSVLASVTMGNSIQKIGYDAFKNCKSLAKITIPASVTKIGEEAFYGCEALKSVVFENKNGWKVTLYSSRYVELSDDPSENAKLLTDTYYLYDWERT